MGRSLIASQETIDCHAAIKTSSSFRLSIAGKENHVRQEYFPKPLLYSYIQFDVLCLTGILFMNFPISITPATFTFNAIFLF